MNIKQKLLTESDSALNQKKQPFFLQR